MIFDHLPLPGRGKKKKDNAVREPWPAAGKINNYGPGHKVTELLQAFRKGGRYSAQGSNLCRVLVHARGGSVRLLRVDQDESSFSPGVQLTGTAFTQRVAVELINWGEAERDIFKATLYVIARVQARNRIKLDSLQEALEWIGLPDLELYYVKA